MEELTDPTIVVRPLTQRYCLIDSYLTARILTRMAENLDLEASPARTEIIIVFTVPTIIIIIIKLFRVRVP